MNIITWVETFEYVLGRCVSFLDSFIVVGSGSTALSALDVIIASAITGMLINMYVARGSE